MYIVQGVPLIPQDMNMACWYASAQMVIQWRREKTQSCEAGMPDPSEDPAAVKIHKANNGLTDAQIIPLAKALGLKEVPPVCPSPDAIAQWLQVYGPLWMNGLSHITLIAGVDLAKSKVFIHNPWPVNVGKKEWRDMSWLTSGQFDSLDPGATAAVFLHCPAA